VLLFLALDGIQPYRKPGPLRRYLLEVPSVARVPFVELNITALCDDCRYVEIDVIDRPIPRISRLFYT
jgi:hypothetical protein